MSLSLKVELDTWAAALEAYDDQNFEGALDLFSRIADSSKILTNMGLIYATIGEHETAVEHFLAAVNLDVYLAIAHFQCGVSNFLLERYDQALTNFEDAYLYLRGNEAINYEQLGLKFKLFSAEILFNKGLSLINLGNPEEGMLDVQEAARQKVTEEHNVIDDAIRDRGEGYTVFSIPVGVLYRPSDIKLKNSKSKDYLGKAKLVAASDSNDAFTEFTGVKKLQQTSEENGDSRAKETSNLNRSATVPAPRPDTGAARPNALERSKTTLPLGADAGRVPPSIAAIASRRTQSVSNPQDAPPPPLSTVTRSNSALGRSNTLGRSNSATVDRTGLSRSETRAGTAPLRSVTPQGTGSGAAAGAGAGGSRSNSASNGEGGFAGVKPRPSLKKPQTPVQFQEPLPPVPSMPPMQALPAALQPGQAMNFGQGIFPSYVTPAAQPSRVSDTDSQFYDTYMDAYTGEAPPSGSTTVISPQYQQQSRTQSPAPVYQPQAYDPSQPAWMQTAPSPSLGSAGSSSHSRAPSRGANAAPGVSSAGSSGHNRAPSRSANSNTSAGQNMGAGNAGGGTLRRKMTSRATVRRVTVYDDDEGDDGFVAGEYEDIEMANIRVKLHYEGDVRGMTIPLTASFDEFVERVASKFGTLPNSLSMKFKDEEGTMITLRDESDFELAVETARESAKGRSEGKIEVWCTNI